MENVIRHTTQEQRLVIDGIPDYEDYKMAEELAEQKPKTVDFDLKKDVDTTVAKQITKTLKDAELDKKVEENMKTWRLQLSSVDSEEEKVRIAMEFEIDTLIEALQRNVERVDNIYLMFCKKEDRKPMHSDALKKIREDMESEYDEITPYIKEAEDFKNNMM